MADATPADKGSRPVPDPTVLTTDALRRDIGALKNEFDAELRGIRDVLAERKENVNERFAQIEAIRKEQKADTERNVADALASLEKRIDQMQAASNDAVTALRRDIDAIRGSLGSGPPT